MCKDSISNGTFRSIHKSIRSDGVNLQKACAVFLSLSRHRFQHYSLEQSLDEPLSCRRERLCIESLVCIIRKYHVLARHRDGGAAATIGLSDVDASKARTLRRQARTGSTFIGELFNQNPNVFYLFEPLRVVPDMVKMDAIPETYSGDMSAELLNSFYHCDFLTYYVYHIPRWYLAVCESNAMQKICKRYKRCTNVSISDLKEECLKYEVMVIKSIRVEDLNYLMPMLQHECFDFKVVLLARDPRAVASSRKYFKFRNRTNKTLNELGIAKPLNDTTTRLHPENVHDYCKWLGRNLAVLRNAPSRARRRIVVLRYDHVVANVTQKALELYKIFGSRVTENVLKWIADNTHSEEHVERGSMATKRNSTSTALAWRSDLSMDDVKLVQSACNDVMQTLGYKLIKRESELINTSASLLNPLPLK
ncbi:carbohydrate sulfotransferase 3-like [Ptychodera flava]|uniref:carbohydrate sulfotransferase 3-like n=1 Tax=Ptychodera flava TaxID=63121 RepID=UPI00396A1632